MNEMRNKGFYLFITIMLICLEIANAQLLTNNAQTPAQLVQDVLLGKGVTVSNVTYKGSSVAIGFFNGVNTNIGLDSGIVMTTGTVLSPGGPHGPNNGSAFGTQNGAPGDPDLASITGYSTVNASVLEFDFVPQAATVEFRYVFGSEEYNEYVNTVFNDAFGFFISGPGISGSYSKGSENIALIPNTTSHVSINTLNNGITNPSTGPCNNCQYFIDNFGGSTIQYDAFTTVLTASYGVTCGATYHLKIVIADTYDYEWDSGVFLEAKSFTSQGVSLSTITPSGDSTFIEGCSCAQFNFTRSSSWSSDTLVVDFTVGGTADNGVDHPALPNSVTFLPGETTVSLNVCPFNDSIIEGSESITINFTQTTSCGTDTVEAGLYILDEPLPLSNLINDTTLPCGIVQPVTFNCNLSGGYPPFNYAWSTGDSTSSITVNPAVTTSYTVIVTDACGSIDTTIVRVYISDFSFAVSSTMANCGASDGSITISQSGGIAPVQYSIDNGVTYQASGNFMNLSAGIYRVVGKDNAGCADSLTVIINNPDGPLIDSINWINPLCHGICSGIATVFATPALGGALFYLWSDPLAQANDSASGLCGTTYYITVTEISGDTCKTISPVTLTYPSLIIGTSSADSANCLNEHGSITVIASGGTGMPYQYGIDGGISFQSSNVFNNLPAGPYIIQIRDSNNCVSNIHDTIYNLPGPAIDNVLINNISCYGGGDGTLTITASEGAGNPYSYSIDNGATYQTSNAFTGLLPGTYLLWIQDSLGCTTQDIAIITQPLALSLSIQVTSVSCYDGKDGKARATVSGGTPIYTFQWSGTGAQSTATATGFSAGTYYVLVSDANGCLIGDSIVMTQPDSLQLNIQGNASFCGHNNGMATVIVNGGTPLYTYLWNDSFSQTQNSASDLPTGFYTVTVTDAKHCTKKESIFVSQVLGITADFIPDQEDRETSFKVNFINESIGASSYYWDFGDGTTDSIFNPTHIYTEQGQYQVILVACYTSNCCDTTSSLIHVVDPNSLFVPNVFTPNGDGVNDVFRIQLNDLVKIEVDIYNRWGNLLYSWTDVNGGWNGRKENGSECSDGVYYYVVRFAETSAGKIYSTQSGHVTLLR